MAPRVLVTLSIFPGSDRSAWGGVASWVPARLLLEQGRPRGDVRVAVVCAVTGLKPAGVPCTLDMFGLDLRRCRVMRASQVSCVPEATVLTGLEYCSHHTRTLPCGGSRSVLF